MEGFKLIEIALDDSAVALLNPKIGTPKVKSVGESKDCNGQEIYGPKWTKDCPEDGGDDEIEDRRKLKTLFWSCHFEVPE